MSRILLIDAGFTGMGAVVADGRTVIWAGTSRTAKSTEKKGVRVADDDTERCQTQARFLLDVIAIYQPAGAVVEMPSGGAQGARANRAMGMATAIVATVLEATGLPCEIVTPGAGKKAATGKRDGSKDEVEATVRTAYQWGAWLPKVKADREHVCDAAAAGMAAEHGTLMRALNQKGV